VEWNHVVLVTGPLHHNMHTRPLLSALTAGAQVVIMEEWHPLMFLAAIDAFEVTHTNIVPTMMKRLLELSQDERDMYDVSTLQRVMHAAASCPVEVKQRFIEWFGLCVVEVYGMSEGFGFTVITAEEWLERPGSVGRTLPGYHITIRDAAGNALQCGQEGEIWFGQEFPATEMVYLGHEDESHGCYNHLGEATAGDVGWLDEDGFLYVTGRVKLMIITGGANIFLEPTETLLLDQDEVYETVAFGLPHEDLGERMYALVVLQPGVEPSTELAAYLISLCHDQLGHYAAPEQIRFVDVDEVPRTLTGKMDRRAVAATTGQTS
jgi:fatty-acyl-CoA synthase